MLFLLSRQVPPPAPYSSFPPGMGILYLVVSYNAAYEKTFYETFVIYFLNNFERR